MSVTRDVTAGKVLQKLVFYKLLDGDMKSCHGGEFQWELGKWYECYGPAITCVSGFHLTPIIPDWATSAAKRVFIAEVDWDSPVDVSQIFKDSASKISVKRCKLVRELTNQEIAEHGVIIRAPSGNEGATFASTPYTRVSGGAKAVVHDCSRFVHLTGGAECSGSDGIIRASGNSTVDARGDTVVVAATNGVIRVTGKAVVIVDSYSTVFAGDNATVVVRCATAKVFLYDKARAVVPRTSVAFSYYGALIVSKHHQDPEHAITGVVNAEYGRDQWRVLRNKSTQALRFVEKVTT